MLSWGFEIGGVTATLVTPSSYLLSLYQDYFRFYSTASAETALSSKPAIKLYLQLKATSDDLKCLIPANAEFIGQQEITTIWKVLRRGRAQYYFHFTFGNALLRVEPERGIIVGVISEEALQFPHLMVNTYVFMTLMLALRWRDAYHLHTAAVVSPQNEVTLICGTQRAGKTTLTTALGLSGWHPISDDGVILQRSTQGTTELQAFKRDFHIAAVLLKQWQALSNIEVKYFYHDRACVDGLAFFQSKQIADVKFNQVKCVLFPEITGERESALEPLPPSEALRRLIAQSMFFPLGGVHTNSQFTLLASLVKEASCHRLKAGADIWNNPLCAGQLLSAV